MTDRNSSFKDKEQASGYTFAHSFEQKQKAIKMKRPIDQRAD